MRRRLQRSRERQLLGGSPGHPGDPRRQLQHHHPFGVDSAVQRPSQWADPDPGGDGARGPGRAQ
ncbi:MAG: hypothetical protein B7Z74_03810, partial [Deltaproteobacteria bacterium 21-66-5]